MTQRKQSRGATPRTEHARSELDFERGDTREGRIGDPKPMSEVREEFPARRAREAGRTGGETAEHQTTADDMTPETLLDFDASRTPSSLRGRMPNDTDTRVVSEAEIGGGDGLDEAELAERDPVGARAAARTQRKAREHAANPNMVEPHEARERAQAARAAVRAKR